jgi:D-3-phosphoglycerate dehydrogenase
MFEAEALLVWHEKGVDAEYIARLPNCRIIVRSGVGFDNIDIAAACRAGIPVCNTPDYGTAEVADHAIAMMLALERNLAPLSRRMTADPVGGFSYKAVALPRRLAGRRFGIVGMGRIGTAAALRARAFGMEVGIFDPYLPDGQEIAIGVQRFGTLGDLAAWCDVLSLHAPLTDETAGMVDDQVFDALGPEGLIVNTARGGLVDIGALHLALLHNRIRAAALDVFPQEPLAPQEPLIASAMAKEDWIRDRLILTPHSAWSSVESCLDARTKSVSIVRDFLVSGRLRNCVNTRSLDHLPLGARNKRTD